MKRIIFRKRVKYGHLIGTENKKNRGAGLVLREFICDCGDRVWLIQSKVAQGVYKDCGCEMIDKPYKHGYVFPIESGVDVEPYEKVVANSDYMGYTVPPCKTFNIPNVIECLHAMRQGHWYLDNPPDTIRVVLGRTSKMTEQAKLAYLMLRTLRKTTPENISLAPEEIIERYQKEYTNKKNGTPW